MKPDFSNMAKSLYSALILAGNDYREAWIERYLHRAYNMGFHAAKDAQASHPLLEREVFHGKKLSSNATEIAEF